LTACCLAQIIHAVADAGEKLAACGVEGQRRTK
jgi:hypothetical protein